MFRKEAFSPRHVDRLRAETSAVAIVLCGHFGRACLCLCNCRHCDRDDGKDNNQHEGLRLDVHLSPPPFFFFARGRMPRSVKIFWMTTAFAPPLSSWSALSSAFAASSNVAAGESRW